MNKLITNKQINKEQIHYTRKTLSEILFQSQYSKSWFATPNSATSTPWSIPPSSIQMGILK